MGQAFCPHCGARAEEWAKYCAECGNPVDAPLRIVVESRSVTAPPPGPTDPLHAEAQTPAQPESAAQTEFGPEVCPNPRCRAPQLIRDRGLCLACGKSYAAGAAMAAASTTALWGGPTPVPAVPEFAADGDLECPNGGHPQFVRKLSAMWMEGVSTPQLAPPTEPTYRNPWGLWSIGWVVAFGVVAYVTAMDSHSAASIYKVAPTAELQIRAFVVGWMIFAGPVIAWKMISWISRRDAYSRDHPAWEAAIQEWNRSFWCSKCGIKFDPVSDLVTEYQQVSRPRAPGTLW